MLVCELNSYFFSGVFVQNILETTIFSDKLDAENFVCDLVGRAEKRIKIWDPYVTKNTLQLISEGVGNKKVEVKNLDV